MTPIEAVEAAWSPGERIAFRTSSGKRKLAVYMGISMSDRVTIRVPGGGMTTAPVWSIDSDWLPEKEEEAELRYAVMARDGKGDDGRRDLADWLAGDFRNRLRTFRERVREWESDNGKDKADHRSESSDLQGGAAIPAGGGR